uniref:Uncharacterized protein n=1 Tax=Ananas comosus var. bracteatus TaxID=296719 RepID=A0A6V7PFX1_ANACO|nr:unnamed protein product [Ananas comosus var. bracteatus]
MPLAELKNKYRKVSSIEKASKGCQDEYEVSSKQVKLYLIPHNFSIVDKDIVLGDLILPVWKIIEKVLSKQARQIHKRIWVVHLETTDDNQRIVGLLIPNCAVESVLEGFIC